LPARMRPWKPRRHDAIEKLEPDLWSVQADIRPSAHIRCRTCIARLPDGRLVFMNAVALSDEAMREIEAWGKPALLLAPTGFHTIDLAPFKTRYPQLKIVCSEGFRGRIGRYVPMDDGLDVLPATDRFRAFALQGTRGDVAVQVGGTLCFQGTSSSTSRTPEASTGSSFVYSARPGGRA
jgi:hypothetical protein